MSTSVSHSSTVHQASHRPGRIANCLRWWPVLLPIIALVALACVSNSFAPEKVQRFVGKLKQYSEMPSPMILIAASLLFALQAHRTGSSISAVLCGLSGAFACREIHFAGTHRGIYVAIVVLMIWAYAWRIRLRQTCLLLKKHRQLAWILSAAFCYVLAFLITKRVFKHIPIIPGEKTIHVALEEGIEFLAHTTLLFSCVVGKWQKDSLRLSTNDGK